MHSNQEAQLERIFAAVRIHSAKSFRFADRSAIDVATVPADPDAQRESLEEPISPLVNALTQTLYSQCYAREFDGRTFRPAQTAANPDPIFVSRLVASNRSRNRWDQGWTIYRLGADGEVQVKKGDRHRSPVPGEYAFAAGLGIRPQVGDLVCLQVLSESHVVQPGMYFVFGETLGDQFDEFSLVRFYLHMSADSASSFIAWLSTQMNRFQIPFQLKCQERPVHYERLDAFVVYVARRFLEIATRVIANAPEATLAGLEQAIPLFTRLIRPGIGVAEDPGNRRSFGLNRCQLLAEGIVDAWTNGELSPGSCLAAVRRQFVANGLDLDHPYLNAGSVAFDLPAPDAGEILTGHLPEARSAIDWPETPDRVLAGRFLDAADRIGSRLCRDALWAGSCCNWLGGLLEDSTGKPVYGVLGPSRRNALRGASLYEGMAGIAIFLVRLHTFAREPIHRRTLDGVVNQVLGQIRARGEPTDIGFFTGLAGIAYTLIEAGHSLGNDSLVARGLDELIGLGRRKPQAGSYCVISGSAGVIPVLIDVAARFDRSELIEIAAQHGEHLLAGADKSDDGWSWASDAHGVRNLTGHSHGTAGIAWSLLELHAATGDARFRAAAREALRYERNHFDPDRQNWLDFRKLDSSGAWHEPRCATAWCHGAPGIGMSRLRIAGLLGDDDLLGNELEAAIATTHANLREENNFSLCHGHAGNAELLLLAAERLARPELRRAAESIGELGIERFSESGESWPCGLETPWENPTLMLGLAGIGYFYLRLYDPKNVQPILITIP